MLTSAPVVLLVEDHPGGLEARRQLFAAADFTVIPASNSDDAIREVLAGPLVSLVVTDVHLRTEDEYDKSGIALRNLLRRLREGLPVAGYSAYFSENDPLPDEEKQGFDYWLDKAELGSRELRDALDQLRAGALQYQTARREQAETSLEELRAAYGIEPSVLHGYRALLPGEDQSAQLLATTGYEALLVYSASPGDQSEVKLSVPILFWGRHVDAEYEVELFGFPQIYATANSQQAAMEVAVELMTLFHLDSRNSELEAAGDALELELFLARVFS